MSLPVCVGTLVGCDVGNAVVGDWLSSEVGNDVGVWVGCDVGNGVVGDSLGSDIGNNVVGVLVGNYVGLDGVGVWVGCDVG